METKYTDEEFERIDDADLIVRLAALFVECRARRDQLVMEVAEMEVRMKELDNAMERSLTEGIHTDPRIQVIRDVIGRTASPLVVHARQ